MTVLEAMWSVIRVPVVIFKGVVRICATFGMFVRVISTAVSVVVTPYTFAAAQVTRAFIAFRSACKLAISKAKKLGKMSIVLSLATLVLVVTYL
jgi:hypothetical protein